jgi:hypothetical protein
MQLTNCPEHVRIVDDIVQEPAVFDMLVDDHSQGFKGQSVGASFLSGPYTMLNPAPGVLFMLSPRTLTMFELHTMIKQEARGKSALQAARRAAEWVFKNTTCEKLITNVPTFNKPALAFALRFGFKREGLCTKSFRRDGKLYDQHLLGLEKGAFLCQQYQQ